ncbi:hypothetical protein AB0O75_20155 [Streptomyces sp. NPDC088921]|uniref:hypothetical protein n=1 Tax=unclassified Streptomyces TaxID=2593676 RepID=UPI003415C9B0
MNAGGDASGEGGLRLAGGAVRDGLVGAGGDAVDGDAGDVGGAGPVRVDGPDHVGPRGRLACGAK